MDKLPVEVAIGWDVVNWRSPLNYWTQVIQGSKGGKALELGAGPGGISLWLSKNGLDVICSDLENPESRVSELHKRHGAENISYEAINALDIKYENHFDFIVFKSVVGGVARNGQDENRNQMMREIHKALKPGGTLLFAENLSASPLHSFFRKNFVSWGSSWNYSDAQSLLNSMDIFDKVDSRLTGFSGTFGRQEWQRKFLGHMDRLFFNHIVPNSWKYILYGRADKSS